METIKSWGVGALVLAGWMTVAAYTVAQLGSAPSQPLPVMAAEEMVIEVSPRLASAAPQPTSVAASLR